MTKPEAMKIVCVLFGSFPNARFNEQNFESYAEGILDLEAGACGAAVQRLIRTHKFNSVPAIGEIREACAALQHGPRKTGAEAFGELNHARRRFGPYRECRFDAATGRLQWRTPWPPLAPDIARAMTLTWGSWLECCTVPSDHDMADRARFIAAYDGLSERERQDIVAGQALPAPTSSALQLVAGRNNRADGKAPVSSKGAAASVLGAAHETPEAVKPAAAPAGIPTPIAQPRPKPGPTPFQRRMTTEELDAELARKTGGAP